MNRPTNKTPEKDPRRNPARRTAFMVIAVVAVIYIGFMILVWSKHH